jgi:hypothetical protein
VPVRLQASAGVHDGLDHQVGLVSLRRTDMHSLVGHGHMERVPVRIRIDRHGFDAHAPRGLDDAAGDLATIGDQDLVEHEPSNASAPVDGKGMRLRRLCASPAQEPFRFRRNHSRAKRAILLSRYCTGARWGSGKTSAVRVQ